MITLLNIDSRAANITVEGIILPYGNSITIAEITSNVFQMIKDNQLEVTSGAGVATSLTYDNTIKTSNFSAVGDTHYLVNTTAAVLNITLPTTPISNMSIGITDVGHNAATNFAIFLTTAQKFHSQSIDYALSQSDGTTTIKYINANVGWIRVI